MIRDNKHINMCWFCCNCKAKCSKSDFTDNMENTLNNFTNNVDISSIQDVTERDSVIGYITHLNSYLNQLRDLDEVDNTEDCKSCLSNIKITIQNIKPTQHRLIESQRDVGLQLQICRRKIKIKRREFKQSLI